MINANNLESIFEISDEFDKIIENQGSTSTVESELFIYKKAYEGLKNAAYNYFGNSKQA